MLLPVRLHEPGNQGVESLFHVRTKSQSFSICFHDAWLSPGLGGLKPRERLLPPKDSTTVPLKAKLRQPFGQCGLFLMLNPQVKGGSYIAGVIGPDFQGETEFLQQMK